MKILSSWKPKEGSVTLGVQKGFLEEGMLELKKGRRRQGTWGGSGLREGVCGAMHVILDTEQGFITTKPLLAS